MLRKELIRTGKKGASRAKNTLPKKASDRNWQGTTRNELGYIHKLSDSNKWIMSV